MALSKSPTGGNNGQLIVSYDTPSEVILESNLINNRSNSNTQENRSESPV